MKNPTQPHEIIYISAFAVETEKDGVIFTFMALDGFSEFLFPPVTCGEFKVFEDMVKVVVDILNNINAFYKPTTHPKGKTYIVDLPEDLVEIMQGAVMKDDTVIYDIELARKMLKPVFDGFDDFNK